MKIELFAIIKKNSKLWNVCGVKKSYKQTEMKILSDLL